QIQSIAVVHLALLDDANERWTEEEPARAVVDEELTFRNGDALGRHPGCCLDEQRGFALDLALDDETVLEEEDIGTGARGQNQDDARGAPDPRAETDVVRHDAARIGREVAPLPRRRSDRPA